jgi:UDP:flavonoid glycosyltransferase YjiC (YdhE family)
LAQIVIAASTLAGHVLPMVRVGADLCARGHEVLVLTGESYRDLVEEAGLQFESVAAAGCGAGIEPSRSRHTQMLPGLARRYLSGRDEIRTTFISPLAAQYRALTEVLRNRRVDVLMVDLAITGVLPLLLADRPRPAVVVCGVGPLTLSSSDTPPFGMAWQPRSGMDYTKMHDVVNGLLFRGVHRELDGVLSAVDAGPSTVALTDWPRLADRLVQFTVPEFEYPRQDLPSIVDYVGPVLPDRPGTFEPPSWWDTIRQAHTVIHVTQGTFDNRDLGTLLRPSLTALADEPGVVVVATTGRPYDETLAAAIPANAIVTEWLPYSELLPHVDVMITNGGYGGVQHALSYGVPLIVAGETSDKAEVAARVEYAGVGVNLKTAAPSVGAINAAVRDIATRRTYQAAAERLARAIGQTRPLDDIAAIVEDVAAHRSASDQRLS